MDHLFLGKWINRLCYRVRSWPPDKPEDDISSTCQGMVETTFDMRGCSLCREGVLLCSNRFKPKMLAQLFLWGEPHDAARTFDADESQAPCSSSGVAQFRTPPLPPVSIQKQTAAIYIYTSK